MVPSEVPNWVVALEMMVFMVIKFLWGGDLVATELPSRPWWRVFVRSGSLWLGVHFLNQGLFLYAALFFVLISEPGGTAPTWFAAAMAFGLVATVLAWWFLAFTPAPQEGDDDGGL